MRNAGSRTPKRGGPQTFVYYITCYINAADAPVWTLSRLAYSPNSTFIPHILQRRAGANADGYASVFSSLELSTWRSTT